MKFRRSLLFILLLSAFFSAVFTAHPKDALKNGSVLQYTGYGANRCVSGSFHVIDFDGDLIILDAGIEFIAPRMGQTYTFSSGSEADQGDFR